MEHSTAKAIRGEDVLVVVIVDCLKVYGLVTLSW